MYDYTSSEMLELTLSVLELSCHERAHYDATLYNPSEGHCDNYQAVYNTLISEAIKKVREYEHLTGHIVLSHHTSGDLRTVVEIFPPLAHGRLRSSARTRQCRASIGGRYGCPAQFAAAAGLILLPDIVERRVLSRSVFVMSSCCQR